LYPNRLFFIPNIIGAVEELREGCIDLFSCEANRVEDLDDNDGIEVRARDGKVIYDVEASNERGFGIGDAFPIRLDGVGDNCCGSKIGC
jgi:hypothetical protein